MPLQRWKCIANSTRTLVSRPKQQLRERINGCWTTGLFTPPLMPGVEGDPQCPKKFLSRYLRTSRTILGEAQMTLLASFLSASTDRGE